MLNNVIGKLTNDFWYIFLSKINIKTFLFFFVFSCVIYGNSFFTNQMPIPGMLNIYLALCFLFVFLGFIQLITYHEFKIKIHRNFQWFLLYPLVALVSYFVNYNSISDTSTHKIKIFLIPWIISLVILQIFNFNDIKKVPTLFFAFSIINIALVFIFYVNTTKFYFLADGLFSDRNQIARYLSVVNSFLLITFLTTRNVKLKFAISPFLISILICITFFLSRAGYLLYASSTAFILWSTKKKNIRVAMLLTFPILLLVFGIMTSIRIKRDKMDISNASDLGRIALLKASFNMIVDKPILGVGYGMSSDKYPSYQDKKFPGLATVKTIHNCYVAVFAEQGIIGLLIYLLLNFSIMYDLFRIIQSKNHFKEYKIEMFFLTSLGIFLIHGLVNPSFDYVAPYWIIIVSSMIVITHNSHILKSEFKPVKLMKD